MKAGQENVPFFCFILLYSLYLSFCSSKMKLLKTTYVKVHLNSK